MRLKPLRTLIIDNYDSFTFNLFQLVAEVNGVEPRVIPHDALPWEALDASQFDNIILSPGPGRPENPKDFGICLDALEHSRLPILGVCLGHQGLALQAGGAVIHAPQPMHGRLSPVYHSGHPLFDGIPQGFEAVRYHSLVVDSNLPESLQKLAWTADGLIMALAHTRLPRWGVQFHPESISTQSGRRLLENFRALTLAARGQPPFPPAPRPLEPSPRQALQRSARVVLSERLDVFPDPEQAFVGLFGRDPLAFWLDSSRVEAGLSRFSYMGVGSPQEAPLVCSSTPERSRLDPAGGHRHVDPPSLFDTLDRQLRLDACDDPSLPFPFVGGYVGYFGYELRGPTTSPSAHNSPVPDAAFLFVDRLLAFDHLTRQAYLVCATTDPDAARLWMHDIKARLTQLQPLPPPMPSGERHTVTLQRTRETYLENIARCLDCIRDGESYELCLTNQLQLPPLQHPLEYYRVLRRRNPAPYAAFLRFHSLAIAGSSPERFLTVDRQGWVESKPIKGTRRRGKTPEQDSRLREELATCEKDRAENLMIVDLLRNDLGRVCEVGTVSVPALMAVETYQTVFQLVSTIRGRLREGLTAVDCVRAAFPGGSMTGAPKRRTLELLEGLEQAPRGIYSGALGFLGFNGTADLNIVIRTLVNTPESASVGIGGAIVALSDAEEEFEETLVKARALLESLLIASGGEESAGRLEEVLAALRMDGRGLL